MGGCGNWLSTANFLMAMIRNQAKNITSEMLMLFIDAGYCSRLNVLSSERIMKQLASREAPLLPIGCET